LADSFIQVPPDSTGKLVDAEQLTVGANTVQRQRHEITGASASEVARVVNAQPAGTEYGLVVREAQKGQATMANSQPVAIASDQTVIPVSDNAGSLTVDGTVSITANSSVNVAQINGVTPLMGNGTTGTGSPRVTIASDNTAFTVNAAQSGTWTVQPGNTANTTAWLVSNRPATSGGLTIKHLISGASTNATNVKGSAGQVYGWTIFNTNAATRYVKLHNTAGTPTAGASVVQTIAVPPSGGNNWSSETGIAFGTGIAFTTVTGTADADSAAVGANDLVIDIFYN
jgi:hypothetical protein